MPGEKILLIEDDNDLQKIIIGYLEQEGYEVLLADNGSLGVEKSKENPMLILLDLMLPQMDGFEVCRTIRMQSYVPIIVISAKNSDMDKMLSLGIGADDYVEKPFSLPELSARIKSHIRRYTAFSKPKETEKKKVFGKIEIDSDAYRVRISGKDIEFTTKEFQLLDFLASNPSRVYSKEQLLNAVWGSNEFIDINTITVYVARLREKLVQEGIDYIKTVWGAGYKWEI